MQHEKDTRKDWIEKLKHEAKDRVEKKLKGKNINSDN